MSLIKYDRHVSKRILIQWEIVVVDFFERNAVFLVFLVKEVGREDHRVISVSYSQIECAPVITSNGDVECAFNVTSIKVVARRQAINFVTVSLIIVNRDIVPSCLFHI